MELRGHSHITATAQGNSAAQSMAADNIDLAYAEDGRTLKSAKLVENASVDLPGQAGPPEGAWQGARSTSPWAPTATR